MRHPALARIQRSWSDDTQHRLVSESLYCFDLDEQELVIEDHDFIFVGNGGSGLQLPAGSHPIKQIRSTALNGRHVLAQLSRDYTPGNVLGGHPVQEVTLSLAPGTATMAFTMSLSEPFRLRSGERYRLDLLYSVPLDAHGRLLLFTGAIQPTDYNFAKKVGIAVASKSVTIVVRRSSPFTAYFYEPENMNYFPAPQDALLLGDRKCYQVEKDLSDLMQEFGRARYFTVAVILH